MNVWILIALLFIAIVIICVWLCNMCFDDNDPDMTRHIDTYFVPSAEEIKATCPHPEDYNYLKVTHAILNCETTVTACRLCGKHLTEPKTEC